MNIAAVIAGIIATIVGFFTIKQIQINNLEKQNLDLKEKDSLDEAHSLSDDELSRRIKSDLSDKT